VAKVCQIDEALVWLPDYLAERGPTRSLAVKQAGAELGFSTSTLVRAARELKIRQYTTPTWPMHTVWSLK
jgi:hypothetical protein